MTKSPLPIIAGVTNIVSGILALVGLAYHLSLVWSFLVQLLN